jgi:hypothetical protein
MATGEPGTGEHRRQGGKAEPLAAPCTVEERHGLPEVVDRPAIFGLAKVGPAEAQACQRLLDDIPAGQSRRKGALGGSNGLVMRTHEGAMDCQMEQDLSQPTMVVESRREGFSLAQSNQDTAKIAERAERRA